MSLPGLSRQSSGRFAFARSHVRGTSCLAAEAKQPRTPHISRSRTSSSQETFQGWRRSAGALCHGRRQLPPLRCALPIRSCHVAAIMQDGRRPSRSALGSAAPSLSKSRLVRAQEGICGRRCECVGCAGLTHGNTHIAQDRGRGRGASPWGAATGPGGVVSLVPSSEAVMEHAALRTRSGHCGFEDGCEAAGRSPHDSTEVAACSPVTGCGETCAGQSMRLSLRGQVSHRGEHEMGRRSGSRARRRKVMLSRGGVKALAMALVALGLSQALFSHGVLSQPLDEYAGGAIGTEPTECGESSEGVKAYCSRCENTTSLLEDSTADPSWITFSQVFAQPNTPADLSSMDGQPITFVNGQAYEANQYHYFEFMVKGGDGLIADDIRRDAVYLSLVSPASIRVATGQVVVVSEDAAKKPAYDFYVGQNCVPQEGAWNNQGYGNVNADEKMKSIYVNVTRDARYFIALQSRKIRYGVAAFDFTMKLSRGSLVSKHPTTTCTQLVYR